MKEKMYVNKCIILVNTKGRNMNESGKAPVRLSPYHKNLARKLVETGKYSSLKHVTGAGIDLLAQKEGVKP